MKKSISQLNGEGKKYYERGEVSLAIKCFKEALELDPKFYEGWFNLGLIYQKSNRFSEAIDCYNKNIESYAQNPYALKNLALCYSLNGNSKKATEIVKILNGKGDSWDSYFNLGATAQIAGEIKESIKNYKKTIELNPNFGLTYGRLYNLYTRICDWENAQKQIENMEKYKGELPYGSISRIQDPKKNMEVALIKAREIEEAAKKEKIVFKQDKRGMVHNKKIRIGYLSSDFHDHATVHLISGLLKIHDRSKFEIVAYSHGVFDDTNYRKNIVSSVDVFRDISGTSDKEAAIIIYKDVIDILVDLKGYTNGNRLGILALKPAPIQVTWLGFPGTTGLSSIDYIIADKIVIPEDEKKYYSEKVLYMPNSYQVNNNKQEISKIKFTRKNSNLPKDGFIFGSFNQAYKITPETFKVWMNILKKVPNSILWLYEKEKMAEDNLKKAAKLSGVDPKRLIFAKYLSKEEHLARLKLIDLALDTFTYNGHTTTSDCLWAGVLVITLKGNHFASRVSASLLTNVGLPELITNSQKDYENLAIKIANDKTLISKLKSKLTYNQIVKPLFNTELFSRDLENIYTEIYKKYINKS